MTGVAKKTIEILIVEDNEGDKNIIEQAFRRAVTPYRLSIATDGQQAIDFLKKQKQYNQAPDIHMIILDINLPRKSGMEVLQEVRSNLKTQQIPVIILTSSQSQRDIGAFYKNHANCFLTKPIRLDEFNSILNKMVDFWLGVVQLPQMAI